MFVLMRDQFPQTHTPPLRIQGPQQVVAIFRAKGREKMQNWENVLGSCSSLGCLNIEWEEFSSLRAGKSLNLSFPCKGYQEVMGAVGTMIFLME